MLPLVKPDQVQFKLNKEKVIKFKLYTNRVSIGKKGKKKILIVPIIQFWVVTVQDSNEKKQEDKKYILELITPESSWKVFFKTQNERSAFVETINHTMKTNVGTIDVNSMFDFLVLLI